MLENDDDVNNIDGHFHGHQLENLIFAKACYILYLVSFLGIGFTSIVGLIISYIHYGEGPPWLDTHYRFQIRTFWIGLTYVIISAILTPILIGFLGFFMVVIWVIVRSLKGLKLLIKHKPIDNCTTWWF